MKPATSASRLGAADTVALGLAIGLGAAVVEVSIRALQMLVLHQATQLSLHMTWMIPLAAATLFVAVAGVLAAAGRLFDVLRRPVVSIAVFGAAVLAPLVLSIGSLHPAAGTVLVIGMAVQLARFLVRRLPAPQHLARRALPAILGLSLLLPVATLGTAAATGRLALARLPAFSAGTPNVLLIILDTVRASGLTPYGYERDTTPNLDRFAAGATLFESAWSTSPWTLSSHATMFTGQYVNRLSTSLVDPLDDTYPTLAEYFRDLGYATAGFTANLRYTSRETGLARGFVHYEDHPVSVEMVLFSNALTRRMTRVARRVLGIDQRFVRKHASSMTDDLLDWLPRRDDRPFFAFVNYYDAHAPYLPPDSLAERYGPRRDGRALADLSVREHWSPREIRAERDAYDAMLLYLDGELGRLFDSLEARGLADNTIVVVTADHGEQFGEHGLMDHGNSLYEPVLRVPLIVRYPGVVPAGRVERPVSLRDLAATLTALAGRPGTPFPGSPLIPRGESAAFESSSVLSEVREGIRTPPWQPLAKGPMKSLVLDGYHYIREGDGSEELYSLAADPAESDNLAATLVQRIESMRQRVRELTADEIVP